MFGALAASCAIATLTPTAAHAEVVALAPLLPSKAVTAEKAHDILTLISSEIEFMDGVEEVIETEAMPPNLTCLAQTSCLRDITATVEADTLITGGIDKIGADYVLDLLYYSASSNKIVRRKVYTLKADSSALLDQINPILVELRTGVTSAATAAQKTMSDVAFEDESEEMAFDPTRTGLSEAEPEPEPTGGPSTAAEEEFDPNAFSFGTDASQITFEVGEITTDPAPEEPTYADPEPTYADPEPTYADPEPTYEAPQDDWRDDSTATADEPYDRYSDQEDEEAERASSSRDEDDDRTSGASRASSSSSSPSRSSSSSVRSASSEREKIREYKRFHLTVRGGFTNYGIFNFGTAGAEAQVRTVKGLFIDAGVDLHIVRRALPPDLAQQTGRSVETSFIWPINAGLIYRFQAGIAQPYVGVDAIFTNIRTVCVELTSDACANLADPNTETPPVETVDYIQKQTWATGVRGRLGVDLFVSRHLGFNLDASLGYWRSTDWPNVDPRLRVSGVLPHFGGGLVFAF
jgi:hypothetical protein